MPWLRSLDKMDEWAWSVLKGDVLPHGKVKEIMDKHRFKDRDEIEDLDDVLEEASKAVMPGRARRASRTGPKIPVFIDNQAAITILSKGARTQSAQRRKLERASEVARERLLARLISQPNRSLSHVGYFHTYMLPEIIQVSTDIPSILG